MILASLFIIVTVTSVTHGRALDSRSVPMTVDSYGNRVFLIRQQQNPMGIYPHRSMMFTGVYQPMHRPSNRQATGVFAQGNAVSSDAYLGTQVPKYFRQNSEAIDEPEISSAEAEASPEPYDIPIIDEKQSNPELENEDENVHDDKHIQSQDEESPEHLTEVPVAEEPSVSQTNVGQRPTKTNRRLNKGKKTKIHVDDVEEDEEDEDDEDDTDEIEEPSIPLIPLKGNRRGISALNNFFPMVFSFPKSLRRGSSSGSAPPGMITAIANSFSTGKGGVASSVASAYGGSPNSKKKLRKSRQE